MNLNLIKPLAVFDLETTGINVATDRIVEISILKVNPDYSKETLTMRINPEMPIPLETSEIHGIYDIDVTNAPTFAESAAKIVAFIADSDLAGFNSNRFDVPLLIEEFLRAEIAFKMEERKCVDIQNIFHKKEQRTLVAAYQFYCDKDLTNAHSAEADTLATYEVLEAQLEKYKDLSGDIDYLAEYSTMGPKTADFARRIGIDDKGVEIFNFGKNKGKSVEETFRREPGYYSWMMKGDFPGYTKAVITRIKNRIKQ
ncbi:MAG: exonuclease domain-containing protein [Flavobacteriales bacterium]|nr:exonuclease domain-containing protein [Flavobacteriales bacterium]